MTFANKGTVPTTVIVSRDPDFSGNFVCDGVADEVEINLALAYVNARGGGEVVLLGGTYTLADSITFPGNELILRGVGRQSFIDVPDLTPTTFHGIVMTGRVDCVVRDLSIQTASGGGDTVYCIFIEDGSYRFLIENVTVVASDSDGFHIGGTNIFGGWIINCVFIDTDNSSILVIMDADNYMDYLIISENIVLDAHSESFMLNTCRYGVISNNIIISATRSSIEIAATSTYLTIEGNVCYTTGHRGIELHGNYNTVVGNICTDTDLSGILLSTVVFCTITGNVCYSNVQHGIEMVNADQCTISGNICSLNDNGNTATYDGINVDGDSADNQIIGNTCQTNDRYGIAVLGARNNVVGSTCTLNGLHGVYIDQAQCVITNNYVYDNSQNTAGTSNGIHLTTNADDCLISNNYCSSPGDSQEDGINLAVGADLNLVTGNLCRDGMGDGIDVSSDNNSIICNMLKDNDDYGIRIQVGANDNLVKYNYYNGNTTGAILDGGTDTQLHELPVYVVDPDGYFGYHPGIRLPDGEDTSLNFQIQFPLEFQELVRAPIIVMPYGTGNIRWGVNVHYAKLCASEEYDTHEGTVAAYNEAVGISLLECIGGVSMVGALTNAAGGDLAGVEFTRYGSAGGDTVNADVYFAGARVEYV